MHTWWRGEAGLICPTISPIEGSRRSSEAIAEVGFAPPAGLRRWRPPPDLGRGAATVPSVLSIMSGALAVP